MSDASGGEEVAAAEFKVPEPKTRGQKRRFEDAQEHHDQWWLRGVTETDDEPQETHTGDESLAMSTRSNTASAWDAEEIVTLEKRSWQEQDQLHSAGMGMIHANPLYRHTIASWTGQEGPQTVTELASRIGVSHVTAPSQEARGLLDINMEMDEWTTPGHDVPWDAGT
eukprot:COSAG06_NODE_5117_length_3711_cov_2.387320_1_plen_168_part_00